MLKLYAKLQPIFHLLAYCASFTASTIVFSQYFHTEGIFYVTAVRYFRSRQLAIESQRHLTSDWRWLYLGSFVVTGLELGILAHHLLLVNFAPSQVALAVVGFYGATISDAFFQSLGIHPIRSRSLVREFFKVDRHLSDVGYSQLQFDPGDSISQEILSWEDRQPSANLATSNKSPQSASDSYTVLSDRDFVAQLIPKVASLFIAGLSGSGKDFVGSLLCEYLQAEFGAKTFFLDPKNDPNEQLWDGADYQYRFTGTMMEPDEFLGELKKGFKLYAQKLQENGSGHYTILILNELATCATKVDNSSDKKWLSANLQPMLSGLDSIGGCVIVLTQTLLVPSGFNSGTVAQFQKLIICRDEHIENLQTQSKAVLLNGVEIQGAKEACGESPIDRAIYSSSLRRWLSLPALRQGERYYDRDSRQWVGSGSGLTKEPENYQNTGINTNTNTTTNDDFQYQLDTAIIEFFGSATTCVPKTVRDLRHGSRIARTGATPEQVADSLQQLVRSELLAKTDKGYISVDWLENN